MTVKELFQSLELKDFIEPMKKKHPDALLPILRYKEDYDIILNIVFSGEGGTITFNPDGNSDAYMCEGDRYFNIVGMELILPDNGAVFQHSRNGAYPPRQWSGYGSRSGSRDSMVFRALRTIRRNRLGSI